MVYICVLLKVLESVAVYQFELTVIVSNLRTWIQTAKFDATRSRTATSICTKSDVGSALPGRKQLVSQLHIRNQMLMVT